LPARIRANHARPYGKREEAIGPPALGQLILENKFQPELKVASLAAVWVSVTGIGLGAKPIVLVPASIFGAWKLAWLKMLKNSARNCRRSLSVITVSLTTVKAKFTNPGPNKVFRPFEPTIGPLAVTVSGEKQ